MNSNAIESIFKKSLDNLMIKFEADCLTCHRYNSISDLFWIYHKNGLFIHPNLMDGPLSHPKQRERMIHQRDDRDLAQNQIRYDEFSSPNQIPELSGRILHGSSFVDRESIVYSIRITISPQTNGDEFIIFLNYRANPKRIEKENVISTITTLLPLATKAVITPILNSDESQRLRNYIYSIQHQTASRWIAGDQPWENLWENFLGILNEEFNGDSNITTTSLYETTRSGTLNELGNIGSQSEIQVEPGIIQHVARTGRIFHIPDIEEYQKNSNYDFTTRPEYKECDKNSKTELACPLIIDNKVVGVVNIEKSKPHGFDSKQIIILYFLCASLANALRNYAIWKDLKSTLDQLVSTFDREDYEGIFSVAVESARKMGYLAGIWTFDSPANPLDFEGHWVKGSDHHQNNIRNSPKEKGHTAWVKRHKLPLLIGDYHISERSQPDLFKRIGNLGGDLLFTAWKSTENEELDGISPNPAIDKLIRSRSQAYEVVCDIAFPIFSGSSPIERNIVVGVLWAKCCRHFLSILPDEFWILSLISRNASEAFASLRKQKEAQLRKVTFIKTRLIAYHFGERFYTHVKTALDKNPDLLSPKKSDDAIVLSFDIRGSTEFARKCFSLGPAQRSAYLKFIRNYHAQIKFNVHNNDGVLDKTVGDGAMAIFNVYQKDIIPFPSYEIHGLGHCKLSAVRAFFDSADTFDLTLEDDQADEFLWFKKPPHFGLAGGLACGSGFVGSIENISELSGFDYTVYGDVSNMSGKLVGSSRATEIRKWLLEGDEKTMLPVVECIRGERKKISLKRRAELAVRIGAPHFPILLATGDFEDVVDSNPDEFEGFFIFSTGQISQTVERPLLILQKAK